jgi:hypothetical protein
VTNVASTKKTITTLAIVGIVIAAGYFMYMMYVPTGDGGDEYTPPEPSNDTDNDGLPDTWEVQYWGNLAQTASDDPDGDGFTNLQEYVNVTNPIVSDLVPTPDLDTDDDSLPDTWEIQYFGDLDETANGDVDNDGFTNAEEYANGTNPTVSDLVPTPDLDTDDDSLPDTWEIQYFGDLDETANGDTDNDGFTNIEEYANGTNPTIKNTSYVYPFVVGWDVPGNVNYMVVSELYGNGALYSYRFDFTYVGTGIVGYTNLSPSYAISGGVLYLKDTLHVITTQQYDCAMAQITALGG